MRKLFATIGIAAILSFFVLPSVYAQSLTFPNYWKKSGTALNPVNSSWTIGSSGARVAKIWATDLDTSAITIGGAVTGDLTLGSSNVIKWSTDTGFARNAAGNVKVTDGSSGLGSLTLTTITPTQGTITASDPFINHTATWNNAGVTFTNIFSNVTDTASGAASLLMDLQKGGSSFFSVSKGGTVTAAGNAVIGASGTYNFSGRSKMSSSADGILTMTDTAGTAFTRLTLGGTTSSFPAIKRNSAALNFRLADDSADANITAGGATLSTIALPQASTGIGFNSSDAVISNPAANVVRVVSTDSVGAETGGFRKCDETTVTKCIFFGYDIGSDYAFIQGINFGSASRPLMLQSTGGNVNIATNGADLGTKLGVLGADNGTTATIKINATSANVTASDIFIDFRSNDGSIGSVAGTASSGVIAYNTFTGSHWTKIEDRKGLKPNMLLESTGTNLDGQEQLFTSKMTTSRRSPAVIGVYGGTTKDGKDMILSIGTGYMYVVNTGQDIAIGDYLMSSDTPGMAEKQDDDLYHNYTAAKATEPVKWNPGEKNRLISVIYEGG